MFWDFAGTLKQRLYPCICTHALNKLVKKIHEFKFCFQHVVFHSLDIQDGIRYTSTFFCLASPERLVECLTFRHHSGSYRSRCKWTFLADVCKFTSLLFTWCHQVVTGDANVRIFPICYIYSCRQKWFYFTCLNKWLELGPLREIW